MGNPYAGLDEAGAGNVAMGAGLRPTTKGVEKPPDPKVRAPALDPTDEAGTGNVAMGAGLRPTTKGVEKPPDPKVRVPALDPTRGGDAGKPAFLPRRRRIPTQGVVNTISVGGQWTIKLSGTDSPGDTMPL